MATPASHALQRIFALLGNRGSIASMIGNAAALMRCRTCQFNLYGTVAFGLSVAIAALVRLLMVLFIPDAVMIQPVPHLSGMENIVAGIWGFAFVAWAQRYFCTPDNPQLTLFGAVWSAVGLVALAPEFAVRQLPVFVMFAVFSGLLWMDRTVMTRRERPE